MLFHEITPFAQAHRNAIDEIIANLAPPDALAQTVTLSRADAEKIVSMLQTTKRGFNRFEACAIDEWKTKERYIKRLQDAGLYYPGR